MGGTSVTVRPPDSIRVGDPPTPSTLGEVVCSASATGIRRLNRREFANTLTSLLGRFDDDLFSRLPLDQRSGGFDTNALILTFDADRVERYLDMADLALERALTVGSKWLTCTSATGACIDTTVRTFARHAYRRELSTEDLSELEAATKRAQMSNQTPVGVLRTVFLGILASPQFLFLINHASPGQASVLDAQSLANRISYWLTAAPPDEILQGRVDDGTLTDPKIYQTEIARLLESSASQNATDTFAASWLDLQDLENKQFNATAFPTAKPELFRAMMTEAKMAVRAGLLSSDPPTALLLRKTGHVNSALAAHYGMQAGATYDSKTPTMLPSSRQSLIALGAVLTSSSHPDRTSIPHRGMWVLDNVLCIQPPPVPDDVDTAAFKPMPGKTQREQLAAHRALPRCRGCHEMMDELGAGLENFDGIGAYRTHDYGALIDAAGVLPPSKKFNGPEELAGLLAKDYAGDFAACLATNLISSAANRLPTMEDTCFVEAFRQNPQISTRELIQRVAQSTAFVHDLTLTEAPSP